MDKNGLEVTFALLSTLLKTGKKGTVHLNSKRYWKACVFYYQNQMHNWRTYLTQIIARALFNQKIVLLSQGYHENIFFQILIIFSYLPRCFQYAIPVDKAYLPRGENIRHFITSC